MLRFTLRGFFSDDPIGIENAPDRRAYILRHARTLGLVDLYRIYSRPMWFIVKTGEVIGGPDAELVKMAELQCGRYLHPVEKVFGRPPGWKSDILISGHIYYPKKGVR